LPFVFLDDGLPQNNNEKSQTLITRRFLRFFQGVETCPVSWHPRLSPCRQRAELQQQYSTMSEVVAISRSIVGKGLAMILWSLLEEARSTRCHVLSCTKSHNENTRTLNILAICTNNDNIPKPMHEQQKMTSPPSTKIHLVPSPSTNPSGFG
jgi:hypothetical protein